MIKKNLAVILLFAGLTGNAQPVDVAELMNKNSDNLASYLINENKKQNIKLNNLDDKTGFAYNEKGKKTKTVAEYYKWLSFENSTNVEIVSDKEDKPISLTFDFGINDEGPANRSNVVKNLGLENLQMVSATDNDTTYRKGDIYVSVFIKEGEGEGEGMRSPAIFIYKPAPYTYEPANESKFDISELSVADKAADLGYSLIFYFKTMGVNFLYTDGLKPKINYDETVSHFEQKYYFTEGAYFVITSSTNGYLRSVKMAFPDPLGFSKMKKKLGIDTWDKSEEDYPLKDEAATRFRQKNILADIIQHEKRIELNIQPDITDIKSRYELAESGLGFLDLYQVWNSADNVKDLEKYITPRFLNKASVNWDKKTIKPDLRDPVKNNFFYFKSPNDSLVKCSLFKNQTTSSTLVMMLHSRDYQYLSSVQKGFQASEYTSYYADKIDNVSDDKTLYYFYIYDKALAEARAESIRAKQQQELAEKNRRLQEQERERRLKQQRNAEAIQKYSNILSDYLRSRN